MTVTDKIIAAAGRSPAFIRHPESPGRNSPDSVGTTSYSVSATTYGNILGSQNIYEMLRRKQVFTEFYLDCQMGHGLDKCIYCGGVYPRKIVMGSCTTCAFNSNFGTAANDITSANLYIVQRACTFFQAVMNSPSLAFTNITTTRFVECENYRNTCDPTDNNNHCPSDANPPQVCPPQ